MAEPEANPATRKVVRYSRYGDSGVLEVTSVAVPPRPKGHLLVAVKAAGVNQLDVKLREGMGGWLMGVKLPAIPGIDYAGTVVAADAGSAWKAGDRVFGMCLANGCYAELAVVPEAGAARIPEGLSFEEAGAMPAVALAAVQVLDAAALSAGQRVLIHAGAGGVGSFAIQLAKARGLEVATTCSARNADYCRGLGADTVIDYGSQKFEEVLKNTPVHAVLDPIAVHGYEERSRAVLAPGGTYVMLLASMVIGKILLGLLRSALRLGPRYRVVMTQPNSAQLESVGQLVAEGKVKMPVRALSLEQAAAAQEDVGKGHTRGKVVLTI